MSTEKPQAQSPDEPISQPMVHSGPANNPDEKWKIDSAHKIKMDQLKELGITPPPSVSSVPHTFADVLARVTKEAWLKNVVWKLPTAGAEFAKDKTKLDTELPNLQNIMSGAGGVGDAGCKKVNDFLQSKGFSIRLEPSGNTDSAYAVSILDVQFAWQTPGSKVNIGLTDNDGKPLEAKDDKSPITVEGVKLKSGYEVLQTPKATPVIKMKTQTNETVYIVPAYGKNLPQDAVTLRRQIDQLKTQLVASDRVYDSVQFPMVDYSKSWDISELLWAEIEWTDKVLAQAKYEHILKMNEFGGRAKGSAAVELRTKWLAPQTNDLKITGSFLMWVEKNGVPVFQAQIQPDTMKRPANLD